MSLHRQFILYMSLVSVIDTAVHQSVRYLGVFTIACLRLLTTAPCRRNLSPMHRRNTLSPTNRCSALRGPPEGMGGTRHTRQRVQGRHPISLYLMHDPALGSSRRAWRVCPAIIAPHCACVVRGCAGFETRSAPRMGSWNPGVDASAGDEKAAASVVQIFRTKE